MTYLAAISSLRLSGLALAFSSFLARLVYQLNPLYPYLKFPLQHIAMNHGTVAVALVQHQVMIIQACRSHARHDRWLDVYTYVPFGDRLFLASPVPYARIASSDVLAIFPFRTPTTDMIELSEQAYQEFLGLSAKHQLKCENMWRRWKARRH